MKKENRTSVIIATVIVALSCIAIRAMLKSEEKGIVIEMDKPYYLTADERGAVWIGDQKGQMISPYYNSEGKQVRVR